MRWRGRQGSSNIDDRRGGGGGGRSSGGRKFGLGSLILVILALVFGRGELAEMFLQGGSSSGYEQAAPTSASAANDELAQFVSVVLKDTEDVWEKIFREQVGQPYRKPVLVLFSGSDRSACGYASAATGPFYCPADQKLYIDLSFYNDLKTRFGAPGDFAMAYVVAHEVAHHVQNLLGFTEQVQREQSRVSKAAANDLSVRLELQADFYAGLWARHNQEMNNILEEGDFEEALRAANAIGDDRLQMQAQGYVVPESFTHGTSEQRMRWFKKGFQTGDLKQGDTFRANPL
jgi:hypothetical protein